MASNVAKFMYPKFVIFKFSISLNCILKSGLEFKKKDCSLAVATNILNKRITLSASWLRYFIQHRHLLPPPPPLLWWQWLTSIKNKLWLFKNVRTEMEQEYRILSKSLKSAWSQYMFKSFQQFISTYYIQNFHC